MATISQLWRIKYAHLSAPAVAHLQAYIKYGADINYVPWETKTIHVTHFIAVV